MAQPEPDDAVLREDDEPAGVVLYRSALGLGLGSLCLTPGVASATAALSAMAEPTDLLIPIAPLHECEDSLLVAMLRGPARRSRMRSGSSEGRKIAEGRKSVSPSPAQRRQCSKNRSKTRTSVRRSKRHSRAGKSRGRSLQSRRRWSSLMHRRATKMKGRKSRWARRWRRTRRTGAGGPRKKREGRRRSKRRLSAEVLRTVAEECQTSLHNETIGPADEGGLIPLPSASPSPWSDPAENLKDEFYIDVFVQALSEKCELMDRQNNAGAHIDDTFGEAMGSENNKHLLLYTRSHFHFLALAIRKTLSDNIDCDVQGSLMEHYKNDPAMLSLVRALTVDPQWIGVVQFFKSLDSRSYESASGWLWPFGGRGTSDILYPEFAAHSEVLLDDPTKWMKNILLKYSSCHIPATLKDFHQRLIETVVEDFHQRLIETVVEKRCECNKRPGIHCICMSSSSGEELPSEYPDVVEKLLGTLPHWLETLLEDVDPKSNYEKLLTNYRGLARATTAFWIALGQPSNHVKFHYLALARKYLTDEVVHHLVDTPPPLGRYPQLEPSERLTDVVEQFAVKAPFIKSTDRKAFERLVTELIAYSNQYRKRKRLKETLNRAEVRRLLKEFSSSVIYADMAYSAQNVFINTLNECPSVLRAAVAEGMSQSAQYSRRMPSAYGVNTFQDPPTPEEAYTFQDPPTPEEAQFRKTYLHTAQRDVEQFEVVEVQEEM